MRLAGIEKGGYYPYPPHMAEAISVATLSGLSRFQREHAVEFSILARVKA